MGRADPPTVILVGPPGAGKTSAGAALARHLGRPFLDLDDALVAQAGLSIAEIFAREGEAGFRARERTLALTLGAQPPQVIAAGGGLLGDSLVRAHLTSLGRLVCLTAAPRILAQRLSNGPLRPLLPEPTPDALTALLARRRSQYDSVPLVVDSSARDPEAVARTVADLVTKSARLDLVAVPVAAPSGGYRAVSGAGALDLLGPLLLAQGVRGRVLVVTDTTVEALYGAAARASLAAAGLQVTLAVLAPGEGAKTLSTVADLYATALAAGLDRGDTVLALGGGVVSDVAGFAAATYLRGLRFVVAPTSLLAMVDASLGGKTGVNLPAGKNLVGAFHHPALVLADPATLASLPPSQIAEGLAEIVKAALIGAPELLAKLEANGAPRGAAAWGPIIVRAQAVKAAIVSEDPYEQGRRQVLNLGHTFAHAFETASAYRLSHGQAVSLGLVAAARLGARMGLGDPALDERLRTLFDRLDLPTTWPDLDTGAVLAAMAVDKKRRAGRLRFVIPQTPGAVTVVDAPPEDMVLGVIKSLAS